MTLTATRDELAALGWVFDRYVNGVLMAEGVEIERASSFMEACVSATHIASRGPNGEVPVLVLVAPSALSSHPEVMKLVAEAVAAERERIAHFCHYNAVGLDPRRGFVIDPWTEEQGGKHPGHAYAAAIRAKDTP